MSTDSNPKHSVDFQLCVECHSMLATCRGLRALKSDEGWKHTTLSIIESRDGPPCQLCEFLFGDFLRGSSLRYAFSQPLRVFADLYKGASAAADVPFFARHPLHNWTLSDVYGVATHTDHREVGKKVRAFTNESASTFKIERS